VAVAADHERRPIRLVVRDPDLRRSRLTVFFRLFLVLPHFVWLALWGFAANIVSFVLWLAVLIEGRVPTSLHGFMAGYVRYATHVGAYLFLAAGPYPGFRGAAGYPVDLEIDPPARQSRLSALVRIVLALPALTLAATLGAGLAWSAVGALVTFGIAFVYAGSGLAGTTAFLTWFAALVTGRAPRGLRDATTYALDYNAQTSGYLLFLTGRYPTSDPHVTERYADLPEHDVRLVLDDELRRSRLTVLFRLLLAIPHIVWILLWSVAAFAAAIPAWFVAMLTGRVPDALHRFLAAYVRYGLHLGAFIYLVGGPFPGFTGRAGSYGVDVDVAPRARQNRWKTAFRLILGIPAFLVAGAFGGVALAVAFLGWFYALVMGRMPEGMRNLGAASLRYSAQSWAYTLLVTDRYPDSSPALRPRADPRRSPLPMLLLPPPPPAPGPIPGVVSP
jgi:hypothetical protein